MALILLVDDEEIITVTLSQMLKRAGWDVLTVNTNNELIAHIDSIKTGTISPDIVILDYYFSAEKTAEEYLQKLKESKSDIKVILSSGDGQIAYMEKGFDALIPKPCSMKLLTEIVSSVLESS